MDDEQRAVLLSRLSTSQPPPLTPLGALKNYWLKAFTFKGRATRGEYNWPLVIYVGGSYAIVGILSAAGLRNSPLGLFIGALLTLLLIVPWIALVVRRCHDLDKSGAFGLMMFVPVVGFIIAEAILVFGDSDPDGVRFD